ncbi:MAG: hypothetical protein U0457_17815 [Candidatus Sericytochromatia bacterium]
MKKKCPVCLCLVDDKATVCTFCKTTLKIENKVRPEIAKPSFTPPTVVLDKKITNTSVKMSPEMLNSLSMSIKGENIEKESFLEVEPIKNTNSGKLISDETSFLEIDIPNKNTASLDLQNQNNFSNMQPEINQSQSLLRLEDIPLLQQKNKMATSYNTINFENTNINSNESNSETEIQNSIIEQPNNLDLIENNKLKSLNNTANSKNTLENISKNIESINNNEPKSRNTNPLQFLDPNILPNEKKQGVNFEEMESPIKNYKLEDKTEELQAKKAGKLINFDRIISQMKFLEKSNQINNPVTSDMVGFKKKDIMHDTFDVKLDALGFVEEELDFKELKKHVKQSIINEVKSESPEEIQKRKNEEKLQKYLDILFKLLRERKKKLALRLSNTFPFYLDPFEIENLEIEEIKNKNIIKSDNDINDSETTYLEEKKEKELYDFEDNTNKKEASYGVLNPARSGDGDDAPEPTSTLGLKSEVFNKNNEEKLEVLVNENDNLSNYDFVEENVDNINDSNIVSEEIKIEKNYETNIKEEINNDETIIENIENKVELEENLEQFEENIISNDSKENLKEKIEQINLISDDDTELENINSYKETEIYESNNLFDDETINSLDTENNNYSENKIVTETPETTEILNQEIPENEQLEHFDENESISIFKPVDASSIFKTVSLSSFINDEIDSYNIKNNNLGAKFEQSNEILDNITNEEEKLENNTINNLQVNIIATQEENKIESLQEENIYNNEIINETEDNKIESDFINDETEDNIETYPEKTDSNLEENSLYSSNVFFSNKNETNNDFIEKTNQEKENVIENKKENTIINTNQEIVEDNNINDLVKNRLKRFSKKATETKKEEEITIPEDPKIESIKVEEPIQQAIVKVDIIEKLIDTTEVKKLDDKTISNKKDASYGVLNTEPPQTLELKSNSTTVNIQPGARSTNNEQAMKHYNIAKALCVKNDYMNALYELETSVKLDPAFEQAHILLSRTFLKLKSLGKVQTF